MCTEYVLFNTYTFEFGCDFIMPPRTHQNEVVCRKQNRPGLPYCIHFNSFINGNDPALMCKYNDIKSLKQLEDSGQLKNRRVEGAYDGEQGDAN